MGRVVKLRTRVSSSVRGPLSARNVRVTSRVNSCPSAGVLLEASRCGSRLKANDKPMLLASIWPPSVTASKVSCRQNPSAAPSSSCCTVMRRPGSESGEMSGAAGKSGATRAAMPPASTTRTRAGTVAAPNTGAIMKQAPMRTNGQNSCSSQCSSCPGLRVIMAASVKECRDALDEFAGVARQHLEHPWPGYHEGGRHRQQLWDERQRALVDLRRRLEGADDESGEQCHQQQRRGQQQGDLQCAAAD